MSTTTQFDPVLKTTYDMNVMELCQQKDSVVASLVVQKTMEGKEKAFDQIDSFEFASKVGKYAGTTPSAVEMKERLVYATKEQVKKIYDDLDELNTMIDINSNITTQMAYAVKRNWDTKVLKALLGNAVVREKNTSTISTTTIGVGSYIAGIAKGLTLLKLINAKKYLDSKDVPSDEKRYCVLHPTVLNSFLNAEEVKNFDNNTVKALIKGEIDEFLGFTFVKTTLCDASIWGTLPTTGKSFDGTTVQSAADIADTAADYPVICFTEKAGVFATYKPFESIIQQEEAYDYDWILYGKTIAGATRMDEDRIVVIAADGPNVATVV